MAEFESDFGTDSQRIYEHVAQHRAENPAHRILSCLDPRGLTGRGTGRILRGCATRKLRDMSMASAWGMARRMLKKSRRNMDAAMRFSGVRPHT